MTDAKLSGESSAIQTSNFIHLTPDLVSLHPTDLQKKEKMERNEILKEAILYGVPLRQLSRLTGISYGVIQRINGKMKLGQ